MGKGSKRRPAQVSEQEETLRWKLALGYITFKQYKQQRISLKKRGLWGTSGRSR